MLSSRLHRIYHKGKKEKSKKPAVSTQTQHLMIYDTSVLWLNLNWIPVIVGRHSLVYRYLTKSTSPTDV